MATSQQIASLKKEADRIQKSLNDSIASGQIKRTIKPLATPTKTDTAGAYSKESLDALGSARGDEFAPAFEAAGGMQPGESITETLDRRAGQGGGGNVDIAKAFAESQKFKGNTPVLNSGATEPTVLTDTNIREKVIPDIDKRLDKLAEKGQYYDANGNLHNADGTLVEQPQDGTTGYTDSRMSEANALTESANEDSKLIFDTLDSLMKQTDQATAREIKSIKAQYDVREQQLAEINRREQLSENTSLLLGGSSRYTSSASGISAGFARAGIMELAALDAEEASAISTAESARADKNYQLASKKLDYVEKLRKEKQDKASEIAKAVAEENKTMRENMIKQTKDNAIVELFANGVTDPIDLLNLLSFDDNGNPTGSDITLEEIADTLKLIQPPDEFKNATADFKTYKIMQKSGDVPESWSFFDYKTAIGNATRAPKTTESGDFTETEKRKLEQKFGSDWENNTTRKEQLDHIYGEGSDREDITFTDTQLVQGAASAGVSIEQFKMVSSDDQNEYINGTLKDFAIDIADLESSIDSEKEGDKEEVYAMIRQIIQSAGFDPETYRGGEYADGTSAEAADALFNAYKASR